MEFDNNDINIISLIREGNEDAFEYIFKKYYAPLCAFASNYIEESECENIVQETMLWLWENRRLLIPDYQLKSFLFTVVKNKCLNVITQKGVKNRVHQELFDKYQNPLDNPDFYISDELQNIIETTVNNMPEDYRTAFVLNRYDCKKYDEIAEILGVSPKTISYRISNAIKILRVALKEYLLLLL